MTLAAPRVLVVVPTYEERDNLGALVPAVLAQAERAPGPLELLVVDDASPDGTGDLARELARRDPRVHALHRPRKEGLGRAYAAGFRWALALEPARAPALVVTMDADLSHDPAALPALLDAAAAADLVCGSRWVPGGGTRNWGLGRRLLSRGGSRYAARVLGLELRDLTGGFRVYRRELLARLPLEALHAGGYGFQIEMLLRAVRAGARVAEVPILFEERRVGRSKLGWRDVSEAALLPWLLRRV
ncbi:MAG: polyprenol monophosphomannose synthase [Planctomycetota bacterium]